MKREVYETTDMSEQLKWLAYIRDIVASLHKINV